MTQATVNLTGIGPVEIDTELNEIKIVGALAIDGSYVNVKTKKVHRNKKAANQAREIETVWLKKLDDEHFLIVEKNEF